MDATGIGPMALTGAGRPAHRTSGRPRFVDTRRSAHVHLLRNSNRRRPAPETTVTVTKRSHATRATRGRTFDSKSKDSLPLERDLALPTPGLHLPPAAVEYGYSARSGPDHTRLVQQLTRFIDCPTAPTSAEVLQLQLQNALWNGGLLRAVGATDTLIAAYGIANQATVVHYDSDFDHIAAVCPNFQHRWIVPRGTL